MANRGKTLAPNKKITLLSYNVQMGIPAKSLKSHVTSGWRHFIPHSSRQRNLGQVAQLLKHYDIVALQEVDAGSLRSSYINQIEYLARLANFPFWHYQMNRNFGRFAQYCNGVLSHYYPTNVSNHKLPGMIKGRGAIKLTFGLGPQPLVVMVMHLALGQRARQLQLAYITQQVERYEHIILMGDMNSPMAHLLHESPLQNIPLKPANSYEATYPSWRPTRNIDHIFVSPSIKVNSVKVINQPYSDHLPLAIEITLPNNLTC